MKKYNKYFLLFFVLIFAAAGCVCGYISNYNTLLLVLGIILGVAGLVFMFLSLKEARKADKQRFAENMKAENELKAGIEPEPVRINVDSLPLDASMIGPISVDIKNSSTNEKYATVPAGGVANFKIRGTTYIKFVYLGDTIQVHRIEPNNIYKASWGYSIGSYQITSCSVIGNLKDEGQLKEIKETVQEKSSADEIKKFKDLLDSGAITQEEYDAKKKELLGL